MSRLNEAYSYFYQEAKELSGHDHYSDLREKIRGQQKDLEKEMKLISRSNYVTGPITHGLMGGAIGSTLGSALGDTETVVGGLGGMAVGGLTGLVAAKMANKQNAKSMEEIRTNDAKKLREMDKIVEGLKKKLKRNPTQAEIMHAVDEHDRANQKFW